jgi:thiamine biosynthesis lipoprotein
MDTIATITVYGEREIAEPAIDSAIERLHELDKIFNYYDHDSELSRINAAAYGQSVEVSLDMARLIQQGLELSELTGGIFDISLGMLIEFWDGEQTPTQSDIDTLLPYIGYNNIEFNYTFSGDDISTVQFANEYVKMHFGAIAKGFAVDMLLHNLQTNYVESAIVEIGGEIGVIGNSPRKDGLWRIGIRDPLGGSEPLKAIELGGSEYRDWASEYRSDRVATSGCYERGDHIFDPKTGYPASSDFASATVISSSGALSDALSTAIFAGWSDFETERWLCVVFVTNTGEVIYRHLGYCHSCVGDSGIVDTAVD